MKEHHYQVEVKWTGNRGEGTTGYTSYERSHEIGVKGKDIRIPCSSDPCFRGDSRKYNPEELMVSSISACHMLWYLHLCAVHGVVIVEYEDQALGAMIEEEQGHGYFTEVMLNPHVLVEKENMIPLAIALHEKAHKMCFIANSCNFKILTKPLIKANQT